METTSGLGKNQRGSKKKLLSSSKSISPDSKYDSSCNSKRKRKLASQLAICPVCGLSLRSGEIKEHYAKELSRLNDLSDPTSKSSLRLVKRMVATQKKNNEMVKENESDSDSDTKLANASKRLKDFARVKDDRRKRYAKMLLTQGFALRGDLNNPSGYNLLKCPLCETPIEGNEQELVSHVQKCLKKKEGDLDTDEESDDESLDEYTWAGETRIRASSMLEPGLYACDGDPIKLQTTNEDEELDIEFDEQEVFGQPQYSEKDVIPCCSDNQRENDALCRIRAAITSDETVTQSEDSVRCRWNNSSGSMADVDDNSPDEESHVSIGDPVNEVKSLKLRINYLNDELQKEKLKCLICMEGFNTPLVSVICWHVYCEECWLRTLGAKKLCPQCNTITSPADLRKIYI